MKHVRTRGFALMMAVFLIVTLATIGLYLVTVSTGQQVAVLQDEQGVRAYQAARAGIEVGAYELLIAPPCTDKTIPFTNQGLDGFSATVTCQRVDAGESEGGTAIEVYRVTSTGCNNATCPMASPGPQYVERQLQITITK